MDTRIRLEIESLKGQLAKSISERDAANARAEDAENRADEEWLSAIANQWMRLTGEPWETRDGETREEGLDYNIVAIFQVIQNERKRADAAERAAGALRDAITRQINGWDIDKYIAHQFPASVGHVPIEIWFQQALEAAASTDCGTGYVRFEMPTLHPSTAKLVLDFGKAMADKLAAAEKKYGYRDRWATPDAEDWPDPLCYEQLAKHLKKGDPRDVANYCAFLWYHKLSATPAYTALLTGVSADRELSGFVADAAKFCGANHIPLSAIEPTIVLLRKALEALGEVAAYGSCDCNMVTGDLCTVCECSNLLDPINTDIARLESLKGAAK